MKVFEPVDWQHATPRSDRFDDIYRTQYGALTQAKSVFLAGCGLPEGWRARDQFTVLETGFGLGLNFLVTWASWLAAPRRCTYLRYVSVEAYPVTAQDLLLSVQALGDCAPADAALAVQVARLADTLARLWSNLQPGCNRLVLGQPGIELTLLVGDVLPMLQQWQGLADAVYLDGFSPAVNPAMWSSETLTEVARHCLSGTRLATYTVAGQVRSRLRGLGFQVDKYPGVPPKRERLQAVFTGMREG